MRRRSAMHGGSKRIQVPLGAPIVGDGVYVLVENVSVGTATCLESVLARYSMLSMHRCIALGPETTLQDVCHLLQSFVVCEV